MLKDNILRLRKSGKSYDYIAHKLDCSKGVVSYHCGEGQKVKTARRRRVNCKKNITKIKSDAGGKCKICGYNKCLEALDFHHLDPATKDRTYGGIRDILNNSSIKKAEIEAAKCILICANCHREIHAGITFVAV